jgi:hypothetical protein
LLLPAIHKQGKRFCPQQKMSAGAGRGGRGARQKNIWNSLVEETSQIKQPAGLKYKAKNA